VLLHPAGQWRSERSTLLFLILGCFFRAPHAFSWFWLRGLRASPNVCFVRRFEGMTNIFLSNLTVTDLKRNAIFLFLVCVCARASFIGISVSYQTNGTCGGGSKEGRERRFFRSFFLLS
jgi:hypothetical protein